MNILIINPNSDPHTNELMKKSADLFCGNRLQAEVVLVEEAPKLVSSYEDYAKSSDVMMRIIREQGDRYDGFIVACHSDPNLDLLKEIAGKPVVGIAEASMKMASTIGNGFAVISPSPKSISKKYALARKYHCDGLLKGIRVSKSDAWEDLLEACIKARDELYADSIVLGCANYTGADGYLEKEIGISVLDGVVCALSLVEGLIHYNTYKRSN